MKASIRLTVNGTLRQAEIDTRTLLADFLRDYLGLTGTHIGCLTGNCGACTVIMDGLTVKSCTILAADVEGSEVMTIEGLTAWCSPLTSSYKSILILTRTRSAMASPATYAAAPGIRISSRRLRRWPLATLRQAQGDRGCGRTFVWHPLVLSLSKHEQRSLRQVGRDYGG